MGKTGLVCAVIAALPEFGWTAVKISGHDYGPARADASAQGNSRATIREELCAGMETDTARYLAAGAWRALLVTRAGQEVPVDQIRRAVGADRNIIFESNRIVDVVKPDVCLALMGEGTERKASFLRLLRVADAVVSAGDFDEDLPDGVRRFRLPSTERLPAEMVEWMWQKLAEPEIRASRPSGYRVS